MFDDLLKEKYELSDEKFNEMPTKERNKILMKMLNAHNNIIIFPSNKVQGLDGLPCLSIA
jgi:hypothetical protein